MNHYQKIKAKHIVLFGNDDKKKIRTFSNIKQGCHKEHAVLNLMNLYAISNKLPNIGKLSCNK